jgi:hypothetical protein
MDGAEFVAQLKRENERLLGKLRIGDRARDTLLQKTGAACIPGC